MFERTGAYNIYTLKGGIFYFMLFGGFIYLSVINGVYGLSILGVFLFLWVIKLLYNKPEIGVNLLLVVSFFASGMTRLVPLPLGLSIDFLMLIIWLVLIVKGFEKANWNLKNNSLTYGMGIWAVYCFFEIFNPEAKSLLAWVYAVRGLAMNGLLLVPLIFLVYNKKKNFNFFINTWFVISIILGLYGAKQFWFGVYSFEQKWLDEFGHVTHVLWGEFTRMFSFTSDANQFGCSQAHVAMVAIIFFLKANGWFKKIFYGLTAAVCIYGMFISGTRGAIIIPIIGLAFYLILSKNFKVLTLGSVAGGLVLYLLVFTFVLNNVEPIRRMRTAFNATEDASFLVRLENREKLAWYLSDKPFGGGVGSAGSWGKRFSPGTFLANFETDGHYVRIKAETGVVGLYLFIAINVYLVLVMVLKVWRLKDPILRDKMAALLCGVIGCLVSNFSAAVTVALPTSLLMLFSMCFIYMSTKWDKGEEYLDFLKLN
jgi:hypothetical protein